MPLRARRAAELRLSRPRIYGEDGEICFTWSPSRGSDHVIAQLGDFAGTLLTDGRKAYDVYAEKRDAVTQAQCWVHARRYFERAQSSDPAAEAALELIGKLYQVEKQIRQRSLVDEAKLDYRSRHARPLVDAFFAWCHTQRRRIDLVDSEPSAKALKYAENHEAQLKVYLGDPAVPMDANHLGRVLRVIPMGRKAWLFNWTEVGARQVGVIQSLLTTCRLHDINRYTYLIDVLQRIALHPAREIDQLTPRCFVAPARESTIHQAMRLFQTMRIVHRGRGTS